MADIGFDDLADVFLEVDETFPAGKDIEKLRLGVWPDPAPRSDQPADNVAEVTP